ncbi:MAG: carbohydrate ABC transporter permease [Clostridia bacterium]|nr:carbohydrate ABC transporter permease [Clostridia bacterium]
MLGQRRIKEKIKRSASEKVLFTIVFIFLCLVALSYAIAYVFVIMNTFKEPLEYILESKFSLPKQFKWNFGRVFSAFSVNGKNYFEMCMHSVWFYLSGTFPSLLSTAACSYVYARYKFPGRRMIFIINLVAITLSLPGSGPAYYKLFCDLGMKNSWKYIWGCFGGFGGNFIMLAGFWKGIDWSYAEATYLDGGNEHTVFWKIMIPQAIPMLGVFALLGFISSWSSPNFTMLYMDKYPSIAHGLFEYQFTMQRSMDTPMYFAGLIVTSIPTVILYACFQDVILRKVNIGGLKG